ncbi:MAG: helix-turn-helix transcriptional regulator [Bdellovibrionales bacterium]|nr:helix-turn-helix transcriptional regulator [Bdellovibrionales bacterium]
MTHALENLTASSDVDFYLAILLNVAMSKSRAEKELEDFDLVFSALSHEARRHVLVVLLGRNGRMTAGQIVQRFHCSWPTMTRHLSVLEEAGLIRVEKLGRERHYVLNRTRLLEVTGGWLSWFKEGDTDE